MESMPGTAGTDLILVEERPEEIEQAKESDDTALVAVVVQASS